MKKKTIKFYFFNSSSVDSIFCFSKRAIKQKKQFQQYLNSKTATQFKKNINLNQNLKLYKFYGLYFKQHQWVKELNIIKGLFLNSYFLNHRSLVQLLSDKIPTHMQLYVWYRFKNRINKDLNLKIKAFPKLGMLSSHFVHFISKKNISYQNRSKYNAKIFNLNSIYLYIYIATIFLYNFIKLLNKNVYFFTNNLTKQSTWVDDEFSTITSNWINFDHSGDLLNNLNYNLADFVAISDQSALIQTYSVEEDATKKENLYMEIKTKLSPTQCELLVLAQRFIKIRPIVRGGYTFENIQYFVYLYSTM